MNDKITTFLEKEHISVLATVLLEGQPHAATMHYATSISPLKFVFFTKPKSRKCNHFEMNKEYPASVVVGFDETNKVTFQSEGVVSMVDGAQSEFGQKVFEDKYKGAKLDSEHVVLIYTPKWWRYTQYKPELEIIESN